MSDVVSRLLRQIRDVQGYGNVEYMFQQLTVTGNTGYVAANRVNVGDVFKAKFDTRYRTASAGYASGAKATKKVACTYRVPATTGFLYSTGDVQFKINSTDNDAIIWDISAWGAEFSIDRLDIAIYDIYFANQLPSGSATDARVDIYLTAVDLEDVVSDG